MKEKLEQTVNFIKQQTQVIPKIALVLGSGLGSVADLVENATVIPFGDIPNFPNKSIQGHKGNLIIGYIYNIPVVIMQGRAHYYQGYTMQEVVYGVYAMRKLGAEKLILTNAVGSINTNFPVQTFVSIKDHINYTGTNPLIGNAYEEFGSTFISCNDLYSKSIRETIKNIANNEKITLHEGIFMQFNGPSFETPAEIRMAKGFGVDIVGMSTAMEAIAGKHAGFEVCAISCVTNLAAGLAQCEPNHAEVLQSGKNAEADFQKLICELVKEIGKK